MQLIDSHCHFDDQRFDADRREVFARAQRSGVIAQIVPGVTRARWAKVATVSADFPGLYAAFGLHPMFIEQHGEDDVAALDSTLQRQPAVAVGECGLDFFMENPDRRAQTALFEAQLDLAEQHRLPVIVHARKAVEEVINLLRGRSSLRGVLHSYSGSAQQAQRLHDMGFLVSFGGPLTYPRAKRLQRLAATLPLESIMLESDAPDQPDVDIRGERNEPSRVARVLSSLAQLRDEDAASIAYRTTRNAIELFDLPIAYE